MTRTELYAHAEAYLDALEAGDPARLPWADDAIFTENNVRLAAGDGLWNTISARRRTYDLKAADPATGQVAWFGLVEEHGHPAIMGLRLAVADGRIAEVETIVCRSMEFGPFPSIETYVSPRPLMLADVPEAQRVPRERMIAIANGYFDTLELNDGTLHTEFTDDCDRVENGLQTTNNPTIEDYPIAAMGCADQFRLGQYIYDDRLRGRRFPLVDEAKGIGLAALRLMDEHLAAHDFLAGARFTVADIVLYAYTHTCEEGGYCLADYPSVAAWLPRVAAHPRHVPLD